VKGNYGNISTRGQRKNKANSKPNKANSPPAGSLQETLAPATFGIWIAGKLEFFDGFDILPV